MNIYYHNEFNNFISNLKYFFFNFSKIKLPNNLNQYFDNKNNDFVRIKTHKNNTQLLFSKKKNFFRKFSVKKTGIAKIKSELDGIFWYSKKIKKKILKNYYISKKISYFDSYNIQGHKIKSWKPISKNYVYLLKAFNHYKKIFKKSRFHKIHGDLTFDNILFKKKQTFFLDWEFFSCKKKLWGYDLIYLTLSAICIPYLNDNKFLKKDEFYFLKCWQILHEMNISDKLIFKPFDYIDNTIRTEKEFILSSRISRSKFFSNITPKKFKNKITNLIIKKIKKK